jgi:hypothetical protein
VSGTEEYDDFVANAVSVLTNQTRLAVDFASPVYRGDVLFFRAVPNPEVSYPELWRPHVLGDIHVHDIESTHEDMYLPGPAAEICAVIRRQLAGREEKDGT